MGGKSKQKGASFERSVCRALSQWVTNGERDDLYWRSAMSGGRATFARKTKGIDGPSTSHHAGDIVATHELGHVLTNRWYIECKHYKDLKIESGLIKGVGLLSKFWRDTCEQATYHEKFPMLIASQNLMPTLLLVPLASHLNPAGLTPFARETMLMKSLVLRADVFNFDNLMQTKFMSVQHTNDWVFLHPGELQRILGYKPKRTRVRLK